jgi:hypothetical protein
MWGHRKGCSTVDEGVQGTYSHWTLRFKSDHPPHVLSTKPRSYVKNGMISSTTLRALERALFSMHILVVSLVAIAISGKMVILIHVKHLFAQLSSPVSEARRKIFDVLGTVSILQLLSKLHVCCVGRWWLDRVSICKIRDYVCTEDHWDCKATSSKSAEEIETGPACTWRWSVSWDEAVRSYKLSRRPYVETKGLCSHDLRGHPISQPSPDIFSVWIPTITRKQDISV